MTDKMGIGDGNFTEVDLTPRQQKIFYLIMSEYKYNPFQEEDFGLQEYEEDICVIMEHLAGIRGNLFNDKKYSKWIRQQTAK